MNNQPTDNKQSDLSKEAARSMGNGCDVWDLDFSETTTQQTNENLSATQPIPSPYPRCG